MNVLHGALRAAEEAIEMTGEIRTRLQAAAKVLVKGAEFRDEEISLGDDGSPSTAPSVRHLLPGVELTELTPENTAFLFVPEGPELEHQIVSATDEPSDESVTLLG